jgi:hypothetical protein
MKVLRSFIAPDGVIFQKTGLFITSNPIYEIYNTT